MAVRAQWEPFFNFYARPEKGNKERFGVAGHSFVSVLDFGPTVQAKSILVFGESADPEVAALFSIRRSFTPDQQFEAWRGSICRRSKHTPNGPIIRESSRGEMSSLAANLLVP